MRHLSCFAAVAALAVPQPSDAQLDAAGLGRLPLAPAAQRVDLVAPPFSNSTVVTNPLFPISNLHSAVLTGHVDRSPLKIETTLLPYTRVIEWSPGQCVRTLVSQFVAYGAGRIHGGRARPLRAGRRRLRVVLRRGRLQLPARRRGRHRRELDGRQGGPRRDDHARAPRPRHGLPAREHPRPRVRGGDGREVESVGAARLVRTSRAARRRLARGEGLRARLRRVPVLRRQRPRGDGARRAHRRQRPGPAPPRLVAALRRARRSGDRFAIADAKLDLQLQHRPPTEIDRDRFALWARRARHDALARPARRAPGRRRHADLDPRPHRPQHRPASTSRGSTAGSTSLEQAAVRRGSARPPCGISPGWRRRYEQDARHDRHRDSPPDGARHAGHVPVGYTFRMGYTGGVDLGGTKIQTVVVDERGDVAGQSRRPTPTTGGPAGVAAEIAGALQEAAAQAGIETSSLEGIGIGSPGNVDDDAGTVSARQEPARLGRDLRPAARAREGVRRAGVGSATTSRWRPTRSSRSAPAARTTRCSACSGAPASAAGSCSTASRGSAATSAGEIGHVVVRIGGALCGCGRRGCMEAYAGRASMEARARRRANRGEKTVLFKIMEERGRTRLTSGVWARALDRGDPMARSLLDRAVRALGAGVASSPERARRRGDHHRRRARPAARASRTWSGSARR